MLDFNNISAYKGECLWNDGSVLTWSNFWFGEPTNMWMGSCLTINKNHPSHGTSTYFKWLGDFCFRYKRIICEKAKSISGKQHFPKPW